jgi:hypothetical protein
LTGPHASSLGAFSWAWVQDPGSLQRSTKCPATVATLRKAALNLLLLAGFQSIRGGMQAVMHDITALLAMARRRFHLDPC